jgi:hypothetical protein
MTEKIVPLGPKRLTKQLADRGMRTVATAVMGEMKRAADLERLGFEIGDYGQLKADGCRVTLHSCFGEWEIDIVLPNGSTISLDIPFDKVGGSSADEIAEHRAKLAAEADDCELIDLENRVRQDFVSSGIEYTEAEVAAEAKRLRRELTYESFEEA